MVEDRPTTPHDPHLDTLGSDDPEDTGREATVCCAHRAVCHAPDCALHSEGCTVRSAPPQHVLVYTERSDDGPSLIGPFPSRGAARAHADTLVMEYSESHVEALVRP